MRKMLSACAVALLLLFPAQAATPENTFPVWLVTVVRVSDGDSLIVVDSGQQKSRIRVYGIDCPEINQAGGKDAREYLADILLNAAVAIETVERDRYGRTVAFVYKGGRAVEELLLEKGLAWVYDKYCLLPVCDRYREIEHTSRELKIGLWASPDPVAPWEWRKRQRENR